MKKINIMYLYSSKGFGGMVRNISLIVNNLNQDMFNIFVVALTNKNDRDAEIQISENKYIIFHRIDEKRKFDIAAIHRIKDFLKEYKIDILSCHGYKAVFYGIVIQNLYKSNIKLVTIAHGWLTPNLKARVYSFFEKLIIRYFDKIILVSEGMRKEVSAFMIPERKITVIKNAIDFRDYRKIDNNHCSRRDFHLGIDDKVIGYFGRLSKEKNIETILRAIKELVISNNNVKFLVCGEGSERKKLEKITKYLQISNNVIFSGFQKEIREIYSILDLYVSAALEEGLPNSILEAQSIGIPCIASNIAGNNEIIENGINGFLFRPRDYKTLSNKIAILLKDSNLANRFSLEGKRIIKEKFSLRDRINKLEKVYTDILS